MDSVFRLLKPKQGRRFFDSAQREQTQHAQGAFGNDTGGYRRTTLKDLKFYSSQVIHTNLYPGYGGNDQMKGFFNCFELRFIESLESVQKRSQVFSHEANMAHFLDRVWCSHTLPRFEIEKEPAGQFLTKRREMGMMRRIERQGKDAVIDIALIVGRMSLPFHPQMEPISHQLQKRPPFARHLAGGVQGGKIFVSYPEDAALGRISITRR